MSGQKVCIVDADLRRGYLDRYFGVPRSPGLSEFLAGTRISTRWSPARCPTTRCT